MEMFQAIPPFTKVWAGAILLLGLLASTDVVNPVFLIWSFERVVKYRELWRILTGPFFLGKLDLQLVINMFWSFNFIKNMEQRMFSQRLATLVFIFVLVAFCVLVLSSILGSSGVGGSVLQGLTFIYSKLFSTEQVNFMMFLTIPVQWLPFATLALHFIAGGGIIPSVIGILSGHLVFYVLFILPVIRKKEILKTPAFLTRLLDGPAPDAGPQQNADRGQDPRRGGFAQGQGRRLGD
jgi:hypothetical protein